MGLIQSALKKLKEGNDDKEEKKHMENVQRWQENIQQKRKSADERDLERYLEEERQKRIKVAVTKFRNRDRDETWHGKKYNPVYTPNMFKDGDNKNMFKGKATLLKNDMKQIKGKNLFMKKK